MSPFEFLSPNGILRNLMATYWNESKKSISGMMQNQAVIGADGTMVAYDGSLISLIRVEGTSTIMGEQDHARMVESLAEKWNNIFNRPGYAMHVVWENDPTSGESEMEDAVRVLQQGAKRYQLDLADLLDERKKVVGKWISKERTTIALWTRNAALTKEQVKQGKLRYQMLARLLPSRDDAQNPYLANDDLVTKHDAYVNAILQGLKDVNVAADALPADEALNEMNYFLNGEHFGGKDQKWSHSKDQRKDVKDRGDNLEGLQALPLSEQLVAHEPDCDGEMVKYGARSYAPMDIAMGPLRVPPYEELVSRIRDQNVPARVSMLFESDGMPSLAFLQNLVADALSLTNGENGIRSDAFRNLSAQRDAGAAIPRIRGSVMTWAERDDKAQLRKNKSALTQIIQGWGDMVLSRVVGDPLETMVCMVPGLVCGATGEAGICDFNDMIRFVPCTRPRSLNDDGGMSFRTPDGKHIRYKPHTPGFNCDLISGIPGQGKSVLMSALSMSSLLSSTSNDLPYDATIDVGGSVEGFISCVRDALPPHQRHMAGFYRLENLQQFACNIHDTQLAHRHPLRHELEFQTAFYVRLLTPEDDRAIDGLTDLVKELLEQVYILKAGQEARSQPNKYVRGNLPDVDDALARFNISVNKETLWWEIVDALFDRNEYHLAGMAQRYAVPTMRDMVSALNTETIQKKAQKIAYSASENLFNAILRILEPAIANFPILCNPTQFDISDTKIIGIDVANVAPQDDSAASKRQTALMFMLARFVAVRSWWIPETALREIPERLQNYHGPRIRRILEVQKTIKYDEAHRASGLWPAILLDIRETRKKHFHVILGSQLPTDYPSNIRKMANRHWLMSAGIMEEETEEIARVYGFNDALKRRARTALHKPDKRGAAFLNLLQNESGFYTQHLYLTMGAMELWAYSTEPKDASFRKRLEERVPAKEARRLLARHYPSASILRELGDRRAHYEQMGQPDKANDNHVMEEMIEALLKDRLQEIA